MFTKRAISFSAFLLWGLLAAPTHAQRNLTQIPDVDPDVERQTFVMPEGLKANLFAGDPHIAKPIQMNFDGRGRLWVAGSEVYPHIKPGQESNDKILVLEDTDQDGVVDQTTVFAEGLLIPTGVLPDENGGCYVANSTELLHLADTDADGVADQRRVILSGFGTEDTHHLLHTLRWAPDGSLFMNQSIYIHSHVETPRGVRHLNGGGLWRFRPDTLELEVYCKGFVNPWGTVFDPWGQTFVTDGAYSEGVNFAFPDSVFVSSPGARRIMSGLNPGSPKHCGLELISGPHFPEDWEGSMVTNDFRANRVCRFVVTDNATGYSSRQATEIIRSSHVAFRPIDAKMGPDGALYIADWYNPIIQHGEVDFRDPRRDHVHGRVWRVTMEGRPLAPPQALHKLDVAGLIAQLSDPLDHNRLWAKRYLRTKPRQEVLNALENVIAATPSDGTAEREQLRLEYLWAGLNMDHLNQQLLDELLGSQDANARTAALRVAGNFLRSAQPQTVLQLAGNAVNDPSPHVRLEAVCQLGRIPGVKSAELALQTMSQPLNPDLDFALWNTLRQLTPHWLPAAQAGQLDFGGDVARLSFALEAAGTNDTVGPLISMLNSGRLDAKTTLDVLKQAGEVSNPNQLVQLSQWVADSQEAEQRLPMWEALALNSKNVPAQLPTSLEQQFAQLGQLPTGPTQALLNIASRWKVGSVFEQVSKMSRDSDSLAIRQQAMETLSVLALGSPERRNLATTELQSIANAPSAPLELRTTAASALARLNVQSAAEVSAVLLNSESEDATAMWLESLLAQKGGQEALQQALAGKSIPAPLARQLVRRVQSSSQPSVELIEVIRVCGDLKNAGWKFDAQQQLAFLQDVQTKGNPFVGESIYRRSDLQCLNCHAIGGVGSEVGPDMISIGASAPVDYLLTSLLDPNDKVKEGYHSKLVQTIEGKVLSGIVVRQAGGVLELRLADNSIVKIPEDDIEEMADGKSLMPAGLVDTLTRDELRDLVCFLSKLGKEEPFAIRGQSVTRAWQVMPWDREANHRLNRTSFDTIASNDPAMVWQDLLPLVSGAAPVADQPKYKIHANVPETTFLRTCFKVTRSGEVIVTLNQAERVQAWLDRNPVVARSSMKMTLEPGLHVLYFAVRRDSEVDPLQVTITPADENGANLEFPLKWPAEQ